MSDKYLSKISSSTMSSRMFVLLSGLVAVAVGSVTMTGYLLDNALLKTSILPWTHPMKANTSLGLIALGLSLVLLARKNPSITELMLSKVFASATVLLGLATLAKYMLGMDFGIDNAIIGHTPAFSETQGMTVQMSAASAFIFFLLGGALFLIKLRFYATVAQTLAIMAALLALVPLSGHLYGGEEFISLSKPMHTAIISSVLFILVSLGTLVIRPAEGLMSLVFSKTSGGWLIRHMLPLTIGIPILAGWLSTEEVSRGFLNSHLSNALLIVFMLMFMTVLIFHAGVKLNKIDLVRRQTEELLSAQEEKYRTVAEFTQDLEYWLAPDGRLTYVSPSCENITGYKVDDFMKNPALMISIAHPDDRHLLSVHSQDNQNATSDPGQHELDFRIITRSGKERWIGHVCRRVYDSNGVYIGRRASNRDITERKAASENLRRLNRELRAISNCNQTLMRAEEEQSILNDICRIVCDDAGYCLAWVGYVENNESKTISVRAWAGSEDRYFAEANISADTEQGHGPARTVISTGKTVYIQDFNSKSNFDTWMVKARKHGYQSGIVMPLKDNNGIVFGIFLVCSLEINSFTPEDIRLLEELAGDLAFGIIVLRGRIEQKRLTHEAESLYRQIDAVNRIGALATSNLRLEKVLESVLDGILSACNATVGMIFIRDITTGNLNWGASRGLSDKFVSEYEHKTIRSGEGLSGHIAETGETIYIPEDSSHDSRVARGVVTEEGFNSFIGIPIYADGQVVAVLNILTRTPATLDKAFIPLIQSVASYVGPAIRNARLFMEKELLSNAMEQSAEGIVMTDLNARITYVNPAFERITGYSRKEVLGENPRILKSDRQDASFYIQMWNVLKHGGIWRGHFFNKRKDGSIYEEDTVISPVMDRLGIVTGYSAIKRDVTREMHLEAQLHQAQKMESIGLLAGGVAHDFNNMLQAMTIYAELLIDKTPENDDRRADLEEILKTCGRASSLTQQLLAFARKQNISPKILHLNEMIGSILKMLRRLISEDIRLEWKPGVGVWDIKMDPVQLDQILANIVVNAKDAISNIGNISIETGNTSFDEAYCMDHPGFTAGNYVQILITDSGCGMTKEVLEQIFEPFFTTKPFGKGTGLGLATVYGIVRQNNGFINVYSEPGRGTTFKIYLPCHTGEAEGTECTHAEAPRGSGETLLLVEDDLPLLDISRRMLENLGYNVLYAGTPGEAISIAGKYSGEIHLLISDIIMPEMDGKKLSIQIRTARPGIKCLFMSGYTADIIAKHGIIDEGVHFIQKPYSKKNLASKVKVALAAK